MPETLEAEIIEIDGRPPPRSEPEPRGFHDAMPRVLRFDRRWWPLWILLGGLLLVAVIVGGAFYLVFAAVRAVLRGIFGSPRRT